MTQYFRKVLSNDRLPKKNGEYHTSYGMLRFGSHNKSFYNRHFDMHTVEWWLEPIEQPLYTKSDMLSCWDAALSHALKLKGYYKTFSGFIKSLKK